MAKRQTRRSVSLRGLTYQRLADYCAALGMSASGYLEELITADLDARGVPVPERVRPPQPRSRTEEDFPGSHFTF